MRGGEKQRECVNIWISFSPLSSDLSVSQPHRYTDSRCWPPLGEFQPMGIRLLSRGWSFVEDTGNKLRVSNGTALFLHMKRKSGRHLEFCMVKESCDSVHLGVAVCLRLWLKIRSVTEQQHGALDLLGFQLDQWGYHKWQESELVEHKVRMLLFRIKDKNVQWIRYRIVAQQLFRLPSFVPPKFLDAGTNTLYVTLLSCAHCFLWGWSMKKVKDICKTLLCSSSLHFRGMFFITGSPVAISESDRIRIALQL